MVRADTLPMNDIHDIKPLLEIGGGWPWEVILVGGAVALLLLALAVWLWKRWRHSEEPDVMTVVDIAPDGDALSALNALASDNGLTPKQYFFRLSAILRRYIERRFHFHAAEMTTEELLPQVDRLPLERTLAKALKGFCREADTIKFAGATARKDQADRNLTFCRDFVSKTKEKLQESDAIDTGIG